MLWDWQNVFSTKEGLLNEVKAEEIVAPSTGKK